MDENFKNLFERLDQIPLTDIKREGKDYTFTDVSPLTERILESIEDLKNNQDFLEILPENKKQEILNDLTRFTEVLESIKTFSPQGDNPQGQRDSLANEIKSLYGSLYERLLQPLKLYSTAARASGARITKISKKVEKDAHDASQIKKEIEELLKSSKRATARIGLESSSNIFDAEAEENRSRYIFWVIFTATFSVIAIIYISVLSHEILSAISNGLDSVKGLVIFLVRLFPISLLFYLIYQGVKNFSTSMHLYTVNKHRGNILETYETFVKSGDGPTVKNDILMQAAKAIFYSGETGYLNRKGELRSDLNYIQQLFNLFKSDN